jgi:hypothetical protein
MALPFLLRRFALGLFPLVVRYLDCLSKSVHRLPNESSPPLVGIADKIKGFNRRPRERFSSSLWKSGVSFAAKGNRALRLVDGGTPSGS